MASIDINYLIDDQVSIMLQILKTAFAVAHEKVCHLILPISFFDCPRLDLQGFPFRLLADAFDVHEVEVALALDDMRVRQVVPGCVAHVVFRLIELEIEKDSAVVSEDARIVTHNAMIFARD